MLSRRSFLTGSAALITLPYVAACGSSGSSGSGGKSGATNLASTLVYGAAPENRTSSVGVPGIKKFYGITFKEFKALDAGGPLTINALIHGQIQVADVFSTDPSIKADNFVVLEDTKHMIPAQNIVPLIRTKSAVPSVVALLNKVSSKLTTEGLIGLNVKVTVDKKDSGAVAKEWLTEVGLDGSGSSAAGVSITVGSANFQEDTTVAQIYAAILQLNGAKVNTKFNIGSRQTYIPAIQQGSIDLIPEYTGSLLHYFFQDVPVGVTAEEVYNLLTKHLPSGLKALDKSEASDADTFTVTAETAKKYNLKTIDDLNQKI